MPLSGPQREIATDPHRFRVAICGRRFGKTYLSMRELARFAREPGRTCWYIAPTRAQGKGIVWDALKEKLIRLNWVEKINESELTITLRNNSEISIKSADAYDRMRGFSVDFAVFDEFADMDPDVWTVVRPTLSDRGGHVLWIGTPKGSANWARDIFDMALQHPDSWRSWQYTTLDGGRVPQEEVELARAEMDERMFRQEYMATFEEFAGRIYYAFDRANIKSLQVDQPEQILVGMDFNIDPMSAVIAVRLSDELHVIDEIRMFSSNTNEMVQELRSRYPRSRITVYPDPASRQRKTSAGGHTDLSILQNAGFVVKAPLAHDQVRDGINAVNARLCDARGYRHLSVDPRCKYTIEMLERYAYKPGTVVPDKDSGYDHMADALRYMVSYIWPVRREMPPQQPQRWTHRTN